jgi:tRNA-2-methylthio-N6-dimethylallyladenosine synthase
MNRNYTYKQYKDIVLKLKKTVPGFALTTDIIVGFPGETESQFRDTAKAMQELEFDMAYLSEYSPRFGTKAALLKDDVSHKEKEERKEILNEILKKTSYKNKKQAVGKIIKCLPYKYQRGKTFCRSEKNRDVMVGAKLKIGEFVNLNIESCTPWALKGKIK